MDHHHPQQYGDPYRGLVPSPQPDHHLHALQYHPQQQQPVMMSPPQPQSHPQPGMMMSPPQPQQQQQHTALMSSPQPQQHTALMSPPQPQQHHHASLASHFHLLHLVTRLADAIGTGTRDQNFDALVEELTSQFARCQQLLNSISGTISSKSTTVEGQRQSLDETRQLLDQRKELITKYRSSVEDLLKGDTR